MTRTMVRAFSFAMVCVVLVFLANNILIFWFEWPGMLAMFGQFGVPGFDAPDKPIEGGGYLLAGVQTLSYALAVALPVIHSLKNPYSDLRADADRLSEVAAFIIRMAFWGGGVDRDCRCGNFLFTGRKFSSNGGRRCAE